MGLLALVVGNPSQCQQAHFFRKSIENNLMKKTFGIIGAGNIAQAVAGHLLKAGYTVTLSSRRDPALLADTIASLGPGATAGTPAEAAKADIVVLALPWTQLATLPGLTNWDDRLVIDATNH